MPQNKNNQKYKTAQAGNVFIIILLGVFLFGALMYMFSRSAQQGTGNLTAQQANIAAQEILNYARLVEGAVDRIRRNGCSESEISFANSVVVGYANTAAPSDNSCHIFEDNGGKIEYLIPLASWSDRAYEAETTYDAFTFTKDTAVENIGTTAAEGTLLLNFISRDLCLEINNQLDIENPSNAPPESVAVFNYDTLYDGDFDDSTVPNPMNAPELIGESTGCVKANGLDQFHFYHVLLAR